MSASATEKHGSERKYQRASSDFPAEMAWGTIANPARVVVISIGGCFVCSEALVPAGEDVEMTFPVEEDDRPIQCTGTVRWLSKRGMRVRGKSCRGFAIEFKRIYPEDRARIDEYVKKQNRIFKTIEHELGKVKPDKNMIRELFARVRPGESTHLSHIKSAVKDERRHFRLRK